MYLFFDTETTGLPRDYKAPVTAVDNWPRLVQIAWLLYDDAGTEIEAAAHIIKPDGFVIADAAARIHGISHQRATDEGVPIDKALDRLSEVIPARQVDYVVAHNMAFDEKILGAEFIRLGWPNWLEKKQRLCTMQASTTYCALKGQYGPKWPKLRELHQKLFGSEFEEQHNAAADIQATVKCFFELKRLKIIAV